MKIPHLHRAVRPLREQAQRGERVFMRFETPPGKQGQVDWGTCTVLLDVILYESHLRDD